MHASCTMLNQIQNRTEQKPVLLALKINKTKVLMENGSLMKVESIAGCIKR